MSNLRSGSAHQVIALLCADIHLSLNPPAARAEDDNWLEVQARPLEEIGNIASALNIPIICAGDVFHRWNSPPELINWALRKVPPMLSIPGQHDTPYHNPNYMHCSAFNTLVSTKVIRPIVSGLSLSTPNTDLVLEPFRFGEPITPITKQNKLRKHLYLAVCHHYLWTTSLNCYPNASREDGYSYQRRYLKGYDACVFGDNHIGFLTGRSRVLNCGCLIRRTVDDAKRPAYYGILHDDGFISRHRLQTCKKDKWVGKTHLARQERLGEMLTLRGFLASLSKLEAGAHDIRTALSYYVESHPKMETGVRNQLVQAIEEA